MDYTSIDFGADS